MSTGPLTAYTLDYPGLTVSKIETWKRQVLGAHDAGGGGKDGAQIFHYLLAQRLRISGGNLPPTEGACADDFYKASFDRRRTTLQPSAKKKRRKSASISHAENPPS